MPYPIENKLVIAVASSALFNLSECDAVFREKGEEEYRKFQKENQKVILEKGIAFPFHSIHKKIFSLNYQDFKNLNMKDKKKIQHIKEY